MAGFLDRRLNLKVGVWQQMFVAKVWVNFVLRRFLELGKTVDQFVGDVHYAPRRSESTSSNRRATSRGKKTTRSSGERMQPSYLMASSMPLAFTGLSGLSLPPLPSTFIETVCPLQMSGITTAG